MTHPTIGTGITLMSTGVDIIELVKYLKDNQKEAISYIDKVELRRLEELKTRLDKILPPVKLETVTAIRDDQGNQEKRERGATRNAAARSEE
jgi:hypothetical protein